MVKGREGKGEGGSRKRRYGRERGGRARLDICQGDPELVTPLPSVIGVAGIFAAECTHRHSQGWKWEIRSDLSVDMNIRHFPSFLLLSHILTTILVVTPLNILH